METIKTHFNIKGRWDGDRNGNGAITTNDVEIPISAPAEFDGPGIGSNPEELLIASATTCYIITLAYLLTRRGIKYSHLEINSEGVTEEGERDLVFKEIIHRPIIFLSSDDKEKKETMDRVAQQAEKACFIGQTLKPGITISVESEVRYIQA